jgi:hypothetical protein
MLGVGLLLLGCGAADVDSDIDAAETEPVSTTRQAVCDAGCIRYSIVNISGACCICSGEQRQWVQQPQISPNFYRCL